MGLVLALAAALADAPARAEERRAAAAATFASVGRVTYTEARAEVPVARAAALVPSAELLHLGPVPGDPEREFHPQFSLGLAFEPGAGYEAEVALGYGPSASGISSLGALGDLSTSVGPVSLDVALGVVRFAFDFPSPAGPAVTQAAFEASASERIAAGVRLRTRGMLFLYDRNLAFPTPGAVDSVGILAREGAYPPRGLVGVRLGWHATEILVPVAEVEEIAYLEGIGSGTRAQAGLRLDLSGGARVTLEGGLLHNQLRGVASRLSDRRTVPLVEASCEIDF